MNSLGWLKDHHLAESHHYFLAVTPPVSAAKRCAHTHGVQYNFNFSTKNTTNQRFRFLQTRQVHARARHTLVHLKDQSQVYLFQH